MTPDSELPKRKLLRFPGFDYASFGPYFITVCTHQRKCLLGTVRSSTVILSRRGEIVRTTWLGLPTRFPGLVLDEFVIMPNHIHGILGIGRAHGVGPVGAGLAPPARSTGKAPSLGSVIGAFKSISTIEVNRTFGTKGTGLWQRNYYEHTIRNGSALSQVQRYIAENPSAWDSDSENPESFSSAGGASPTPTTQRTAPKKGRSHSVPLRNSFSE